MQKKVSEHRKKVVTAEGVMQKEVFLKHRKKAVAAEGVMQKKVF